MKILNVYIEKDKNVFYAYITINADNTCLFHCGEMDKYIFNKLLLKLSCGEFEEYFNKTNAVINAKTVMVMIYKLNNFIKNVTDSKVNKAALLELLHKIEKYKVEIDFEMLFKRMAEELDYKTVDNMLNTMSTKEFTEMLTYYKYKEKLGE